MEEQRARFGLIQGGVPDYDDLERSKQLRALVIGLLTSRFELALAYQPIVNLFGPRVVGYEVLSRFPDFPQYSPEDVFEKAREMGLSAELETLAISTAFEYRNLPENTFLSINVSPHILGDELLSKVLNRDLQGTVIELTEHVPLDSLTHLKDLLARLRARGALIAMDDAGSGYAGLKSLAQMRPDIVKLDRSLITSVDSDEVKALLCASFGDFVGRLDAWLLAEGVETKAELTRLIQLGVPLAQGWALGKPANTPQDIAEDLKSWLSLQRQHATLGRGIILEIMDPLVSTANEAPDFATVGSFAVLTTATGRYRLLLRTSSGWHEVDSGMTVHSTEPIAEVAIRSMSRSSNDRFQPILVLDENSQPVGAVRMERLVNAIALTSIEQSSLKVALAAHDKQIL